MLVALLGGAALLAAPLAVSGVLSSNSNRESQTMTSLPQAITEFFDASNRGDAAGVVAAFTPTAVLDDWGRHFEGREGIASWDRTDNTGVQAHIQAVSSKAEGDTVVVTVKVSGNGFNGTGHMHFQLRGDKIARLDIK
ncbi:MULTISPECIES: nuclear transport factor 2 family protein [Rhodopseudomonas]|nr:MULTISPECIES: nuclear transport factor 2 family protein [Rhodopseudomonas]MDF3808685.1 nuclear transport factor 2 family protein [Rhodopseudomonas sp. BAL398]WOK19568.1 nuclear transport factor 2 family protein [Rhodopseudomonas sp. BAL398]